MGIALVLLAIVAFAANFLLARYWRMKQADAARAIAVVEQIKRFSQQVADDPTIPDIVADSVLSMARESGNGAMTSMLLRFVLGITRLPPKGTWPFDVAFARMTGHQKLTVGHLTVAAVLFDTLKRPVVGRIVRRLFYWMTVVERSEASEVPASQVTPIFAAHAG